MNSSIEDVATKSEHEERPSELEADVDVPDQCQVYRIKRKIDLRICIVLGVMYTASLVDRVNLPVSTSSALEYLCKHRLKRIECVCPFDVTVTEIQNLIIESYVAGMSTDLDLKGNAYVSLWRIPLVLGGTLFKPDDLSPS